MSDNFAEVAQCLLAHDVVLTLVHFCLELRHDPALVRTMRPGSPVLVSSVVDAMTHGLLLLQCVDTWLVLLASFIALVLSHRALDSLLVLKTHRFLTLSGHHQVIELTAGLLC